VASDTSDGPMHLAVGQPGETPNRPKRGDEAITAPPPASHTQPASPTEEAARYRKMTDGVGGLSSCLSRAVPVPGLCTFVAAGFVYVEHAGSQQLALRPETNYNVKGWAD